MAANQGGQRVWYHRDRTGSIRSVTDVNGNPIEAFDDDAWVGLGTSINKWQADVLVP